MRVDVEHWGGDTPLAAWVERVEPTGFTKMSPQGVEEQRVRSSSTSRTTAPPGARWATASACEVRIAIWEAEDVLRVPPTPSSAPATSGRSTSCRTAAPGGCSSSWASGPNSRSKSARASRAGQQVVLNPPDTLTENARVAIRE